MNLFNSLSNAWSKLGSASKFGVGAGIAQSVLGGIQAISDYKQSQAAQKELENQAKASPLYQGSKSVNDYYQQALNRYAQNPYQSQQYLQGQKNILRSSANALGQAQTRRAGIGAAERIGLGESTALGNLGAQVEQGQNQRFGQLGQAAQAKAAEDYKMFDINKMTPYNRLLQLKQMKAQAANQRFRSSLSNLTGGLSNIASIGASSYSKPYTLPTATPSMYDEGEQGE